MGFKGNLGLWDKFYSFGVKGKRSNRCPGNFDEEIPDQYDQPMNCSPPSWVFNKPEYVAKSTYPKQSWPKMESVTSAVISVIMEKEPVVSIVTRYTHTDPSVIRR